VGLRTGSFAGNPVWLSELFERIEYFESGTPEVLVVASGDGQPMPPGGGRDVAVFDRHTLAGLVEQPFLLGPYVCDGYVEPVNSSLECVHKPCQPACRTWRWRPSLLRTQ